MLKIKAFTTMLLEKGITKKKKNPIYVCIESKIQETL